MEKIAAMLVAVFVGLVIIALSIPRPYAYRKELEETGRQLERIANQLSRLRWELAELKDALNKENRE